MSMIFSEHVQGLLKFDREHIWHPYTSMISPMMVYPVKKANGCEITLDLEENKDFKVVDGMSSWWCAIHGYNNEELNEALTSQMNSMSHIMFGGLTHEPAITLVQKLLKMLDHEKLQNCFLADSGSVAVEVAMKMALQYQFSLNNGVKTKFLTIKNGYHGDTMGAMSVCDPVSSMHSIYEGYLAQNIFAKAPSTIPTLPTSAIYKKFSKSFGGEVVWKEEDIADFREKIELNHSSICAVILEPILQGAGGMRLYHPQFLIEVRKLCNEYDIPLIMDEIATGFGRTGSLFAFQVCKAYQDQENIPLDLQIDVFPDIVCVGKALTGGYLTLSAVITTSRIALQISSPQSGTGGCMMHGPTFMGNPLACAVANKSLDILMRGDWINQVELIEQQLFKELYVPLRRNTELMSSLIESIRITGAIAVIELKDPIDQAWCHQRFVSKGVYVRPFRNLCYVMPPYIISQKQLSLLTTAVIEVLVEWNARNVQHT